MNTLKLNDDGYYVIAASGAPAKIIVNGETKAEGEDIQLDVYLTVTDAVQIDGRYNVKQADSSTGAPMPRRSPLS